MKIGKLLRAALEKAGLSLWTQDLKADGDREGWVNRRGSLGTEGTEGTGVRWQVVFPSWRTSLGLHVSADLESARLTLCLPPASLFLTLESTPVGRRLYRFLEPRVRYVHECERDVVSLGVNDWAVWWRVWSPSKSWSSRTPRWRDGNLRIAPFPGERVGDEVLMLARLVELPLPEGLHPALATLSRERRRDHRWPWYVHGWTRTVWFDFDPRRGGRPVDTGGSKGPIYGMGVAADGIEEGVVRMTERIHEDRCRRGYRPPVTAPV